MSAPSSPPSSDKVPAKEKLAYGVGQISGSLHNTVDERFMSPIFVLHLGVSPGLIGIFNLIWRLWDAVTDVLMGWISDNTRTRWGRRRPYMLLGAILVAFWMPVIWLFGRNWDLPTIIIWMFVCQLLLYLFSTIWNIPYQSMLLEITPDSTERTSVAAWRSYIAAPIGLGAAWLWYFAQHPMFHGPDGQPDIINGAFWLTIVLSVLVLVCGVIPAFFCRERYYAQAQHQKAIPLREEIRLTLTNRPFLLLVLLTFLFYMGSHLKAGLAFYTKVFYVCGGDENLAAKIAGIEGTLYVFASILGVPIFQWLAKRHGKRASLAAVMAVTFFGSLSTWFTYLPEHPYLSIFSTLLLAPATSGIWVLLPSLTGDVVDHDELRTGERREGSFASTFSWTFKLTASLAVGFSGLLVVWVGYDASTKAIPPMEVIDRMRWLLILIPALFIGPAIWLAARFPLTTARIAENRALLEARRGAA